ncbi:hypothetical protein [Auraticoccus monumenti]|uniref:DUF732 domain-containing protein n=1 Tax=Auraticoccus monumenti TaxID=675864 RepID=A0A1G6Z558_9ACTN|nr:hypothetical protein [Auraticoccus monumenti]SDD97758.1 hypothetical protein SAMN04489747_2191 [Auraticoccus monumenti]
MAPRGRAQQLAAVAVAVSLATGASACAVGDDAVRILGRQAGRLDDVAREVPASKLPRGRVTVTPSQVEQEVDQILAPVLPVADEDPATAEWLTAVSCQAVDLLGVHTFEDAVSYAVQQSSTPIGYHTTVRALAENLSAAESSTDQAAVLAEAAICEWAGS